MPMSHWRTAPTVVSTVVSYSDLRVIRELRDFKEFRVQGFVNAKGKVMLNIVFWLGFEGAYEA